MAHQSPAEVHGPIAGRRGTREQPELGHAGRRPPTRSRWIRAKGWKSISGGAQQRTRTDPAALAWATRRGSLLRAMTRPSMARCVA
eukprot:15448856-Alexandrium_andersonii.AAC.1